MTPLLLRLGRLALACLAAGMLSPGVGLAQIPSGSQSGGNSGNGTSGSSNTPISTPSFTPVTPVSSVSGVSVVNASSITATSQQTTTMQAAAVQAAGQLPSQLQQIVTAGGTPAQVLVGPAAEVPNITLNLGGGAVTTSIAGLPAALGTISTASSLSLSNAATGVTSTIAASGPGGVVTLSLSTGESLQISTTAETTAAVMQLAAIASVVGLSVGAIQAGLQMLPVLLQASGTPGQAAVQAAQLLAAVQGLSAQTNLANLAQGITTFNQLVASAPAEVLVALSANATFTGIGDVMRQAQSGLAAGA